MATIQNLTIDQDADFTQTLTIKDSAGDVVDLTGQTVTSKLRKTHLSSSASIRFHWSILLFEGTNKCWSNYLFSSGSYWYVFNYSPWIERSWSWAFNNVIGDCGIWDVIPFSKKSD